MTLHIYLSQDRLRALARSESLPDRTSGAALFADISGFTALTEGLRETLGTRQGTEVLTKQLDSVYSALIAEVEKFGGSVIGFAGDAMMCWFDHGQETTDDRRLEAARALGSAQGMQTSIQAFPELGLKIAITTGNTRRFVVGDSTIQRLDAIAGATVARTSTAEHHAHKGEILLDEATVNTLAESLTVKEWRSDDESGERFAVIGEWGPENRGQVMRGTDSQFPAPDPNILQPFIHHTVFARETSNQSVFLTEFRPCVALFVRFTGIDYDSETAEKQLDIFVREIQTSVERYAGMLMDITIGDKGSYAYINLGALSAHEDDARRAVKIALELRSKTDLQLQMGITQGVMRVGAYGGGTRKTFGALGDDVNLAARLMSTAAPGEILISGHVQKATASEFVFDPRRPLPMKGKAEPLPVFAVTGERQRRAIRLQEPNYALPMVGRVNEMQIINDKLDLAAEGKSQVVAVVAEAGLGKSRLVAEVIRSARRKGFVGYGGACQSDGTHTPYLTWKSIWQAFFDVDPEMPLRKQLRNIEGEIEDRAPSRVVALPLLNAMLDLNIPDNDFTKTLDPKIRQSALHALLEDCLKAAAQDEPLLIVIEDLHWIDALSHDLLEGLAKALANYAVCFVMAYRSPQLERLQAPRLEALPQFTRIELHELNKAEAEGAIRAKLAQLYPARSGAVPVQLVDTLMTRSQGNPFYLEELLNYLRDRGLDPREPSALERIELPDSLYTLILSRIDQLSEQEKTTLRVASIVGRLFRAKWLTGYYPELGALPQVKVTLDALETLDITPLDSPEPELAYLFKHIVTHEVTYESLPFATRAKLHEQLARYLENAYAEALPLEALAFHYRHSENAEKQREYLRKAGEAAQKNFANDAALDYYGKLLALLEDVKQKIEIHLKRGQVYELIGKWDETETDYHIALEMAKDDVALKAGAQLALGRLNRLRGDYDPALEWLAQAKEGRTALGDTTGLAQVLIETGGVLWRKGEYTRALEPLNGGLRLAREADDKLSIVLALNSLGVCALYQGDYSTAKVLLEESLKLGRDVLGKWGAVISLNNLGVVAMDQGDYPAARAYYEEFLTLRREMGDKWSIAISLLNLGSVALAQTDYAAARVLGEEGLKLMREMGDKGGISSSLIVLGGVVLAQGDHRAAQVLFEESLALCKEMDEKTQTAYALLGLGLTVLTENPLEARENILQSLHIRQETGEKVAMTSSLIGVAGLVLHEGNVQRAAQILGAVASAVKALNTAVEPEMIRFHKHTLKGAQEQLGETAFRSAWEEGSRWSLEEAVNVALEG